MKRISAGALIIAGLILTAAGLTLMTLTQADSSWLALLPGVLVVRAGTGLFNPALAGVALVSLGDAQSGLAAGAPTSSPRQRHTARDAAASTAPIDTGRKVPCKPSPSATVTPVWLGCP